MNNVRTVSDTKRVFYTTHTRPINSIFRRVVEELMVEMHLLLVNVDFHYDPIFGLGVFTSFHRFMQGYRPEADIASIFDSICTALQDNSQRYRHDAERLESLAKRLSPDELIGWLSQSNSRCQKRKICRIRCDRSRLTPSSSTAACSRSGCLRCWKRRLLN